MPTPSFGEMTFCCLGIGIIQLIVVMRFYFRVRGDFLTHDAFPVVPVSVIVPCKGIAENFDKNIGAIVHQDYPARAEFIFIVPSRNDPAYKRLQDILRIFPAVNTRILSSDAVPVCCSEQILNMLHGVKNISHETQALVFVPCDVKVTSSWLRNMVAPLSDSAVGATTAPLFFLPSGWNICKNIRCVWDALGIQYLDMLGCVVGGSFAVLRKNFHDFGIGNTWEKSLNDDLSMTRMIKKFRKKVRFIYRELPTSEEECDYLGLFDMFGRWMLHFKFYAPQIWGMGVLLTIFKIYVVFWSVNHHRWQPLAILLGMDMLHIYITLCILRYYFRDRFKNIRRSFTENLLFISALAAPLLQLVYAVIFIKSSFTNRMRWGGYTYCIKTCSRITVESETKYS